MLKTLNEKFSKVIAVANIGAAIDTSWVDDEVYGVDAFIVSWYGGEAGGTALANIMTGEVNPSGKLADTFTKNLNAYSTIIDKLSSINVDFEEDIFVGYRYFETFAKDDVKYPFGYGMSYTDFMFGTPTYSLENGKINVSVGVTNTGSAAGKEVVQLYYSAPQKNESGTVKLSKAAYELGGFAKTGLIQPGESETVSISLKIDDMASYDDMGLTGAKSAYVLEAGDYNIYVGNSVREAQTRLAGTYTQSSLKIVEQLTQYLSPKNLSQQLTVGYSYGSVVPEYNTSCNDASYTISNDSVPTAAVGLSLIHI